jgi:hypothetical protein
VDDHIIDTNVLLVASAWDNSRIDCRQVTPQEMLYVFNWLVAFRKDSQSKLVLDPYLKHGIYEEYHHKMTGQDFGLMVVKEKLQFARFVEIEFDGNGHACLHAELEKPAGFEKIDPSDRKFVAVALKDLSQGGHSMIINAVDSDWRDCEEALKREGITVKNLIERLDMDQNEGSGKNKTEGSGKDRGRSKAKR